MERFGHGSDGPKKSLEARTEHEFCKLHLKQKVFKNTLKTNFCDGDTITTINPIQSILEEQPIGYQREAVVVGTGLFKVGGGADVSREPPEDSLNHLDDDRDNHDDGNSGVDLPEDRKAP